MVERERSARSLSPQRTKSGTRSRSGSPTGKRSGERSPARRERERRRPEKLLGEMDNEDPSSSRSPSPSGGRKRSPNHSNKLPPNNNSNGSLRDRDRSGSPRNTPPGTRRVHRSRQEAMEKSSSQGMSFRKGAIQARREKNARSLRRTKSHDESSTDFNMSWRRKRFDMNSSSGKLGASSSNFLDSSLQDDEEDEVDIDLEMDTEKEAEDGNSHGRTQSGRGSPRNRRGLNKRGGNHNISRNQLVRGIDLQDARIREEEEEEARKKRHQLKKEKSHRSRSPANRHQTLAERSDDRNSPNGQDRNNNVYNFTTPKITTPKIAVEASKAINDTAVAASQAANAASVATYQAATAASQTAYQTAMGTAAAASQAANVMSGAAARAAAALTFQNSLSSNNNKNIVAGPAPRPKQQKSNVSERELAARFNFNSKAGSSNFGSSSLRESTNSDRNPGGRSRSQEFSPTRSQRSQEFTAGNGLQLF